MIDDGSMDDSVTQAKQFGATVLQTGGRRGPAMARDLGAQTARGTYLVFIDADCEVQPTTLGQIAQTFQAKPELDALFGSYDDEPGAKNFVAQYKNLFHHYVHQNSQQVASTFWTGCGAINRQRFLALGGFDTQRYQRPSIEDIDLGYRLTQAGGQIRLAADIQVKHLKAWTLLRMLKSDVFDRGIPWTQLLLQYKAFQPDLNLQTHNRISVVAIYGLLIALIASFQYPPSLFLVGGLALLLLWLNAALYRFFYQKRGLLFLSRAILLHWLYYMLNAMSFGWGMLLYLRQQAAGGTQSLAQLSDGVDGD